MEVKCRNAMKDALLSTLRDRDTGPADFRRASDQLAALLCAEALAKLPAVRETIETPLGTVEGSRMPTEVMLAPIVRAGLALLPAFLQALPDAPVAVVGMQRDETTAEPRPYYQKFPRRLPGRAIILDPMLATAGSSLLVVGLLEGMGYRPEEIYHAGVLASEEGLARLSGTIPRQNITVMAVDPGLDERKFIFPGLGDYGDRYFGT